MYVNYTFLHEKNFSPLPICISTHMIRLPRLRATRFCSSTTPSGQTMGRPNLLHLCSTSCELWIFLTLPRQGPLLCTAVPGLVEVELSSPLTTVFTSWRLTMSLMCVALWVEWGSIVTTWFRQRWVRMGWTPFCDCARQCYEFFFLFLPPFLPPFLPLSLSPSLRLFPSLIPISLISQHSCSMPSSTMRF